MLEILVAMSLDRVIGRHNVIPWHLPSDMRIFSVKTTGQVVIMGRKTYDSLSDKFRPLPNRQNIIISRNKDLIVPDGVLVYQTIEQAVEATIASKHRFVIGGEEVYRLALPLVSRITMTEVQTKIPDGDTFFPELDEEDWQLLWQSELHQGSRDEFPYITKVFLQKTLPRIKEEG